MYTKVFFAAALIFMGQGTVAQSFYGLLGLLGYLALCLRAQPYVEASDDLLSGACQLTLFLVVFLGFVIKLGGAEKVDQLPGSQHLGLVLCLLSMAPWLVAVVATVRAIQKQKRPSSKKATARQPGKRAAVVPLDVLQADTQAKHTLQKAKDAVAEAEAGRRAAK